MQYANDQHTVLLRHIENDVRSMLKTSQARNEVLSTVTKFGMFGETLKAFLQFIAIAARLFDTNLFNGVIGDSSKIGLSAPGQSIFSHSVA